MPGGNGDPVTLGEVVRNLERLGEQMDKGFARVDERFNTLAMVHQDVYLADRAADADRYETLRRDLAGLTSEKLPARIGDVEKDVKRIGDTNRWLARTVIATLLGGVVTAIWALGTGIPHP